MTISPFGIGYFLIVSEKGERIMPTFSRNDAASSAATRAAGRRATWTIRRYTDLDSMKADEYAYWQSQPPHVRLAAAAELTAEAYAMKGVVHVPGLQRSLVRSQRA